MNKKYYFIDENGQAYTGEWLNGVWRFVSADYSDRFMAPSIKGSGMKEVSFDEWMKAQHKQGA